MHFTKCDRYTIENDLNKNISLKQIGRNINKHSSISLFIYRLLEKKLNYKYTTTQILSTLKC